MIAASATNSRSQTGSVAESACASVGAVWRKCGHGRGPGLHLRLIADEVNLLVNFHIWTILYVPSPVRDRLLGGGPGLAWGNVLVTVETIAPTSLSHLGVGFAYLMPAEFLWSVHELGYGFVTL